MWEKLTKFNKKSLSRGYLLKFSASYPFEDEVVMMVCESPDHSVLPSLITITGYKAGINCYVALPSEAQHEGVFLDVDWLVKNWANWVWPEGFIDDVWVREGLSASEIN